MFDIDYIAKLSKLDFKDVHKYSEQMEEILSLADEICAAEPKTLLPVVLDYSALRADIPQPFNSETLFENSKTVLDNCFTVPKLI